MDRFEPLGAPIGIEKIIIEMLHCPFAMFGCFTSLTSKLDIFSVSDPIWTCEISFENLKSLKNDHG